MVKCGWVRRKYARLKANIRLRFRGIFFSRFIEVRIIGPDYSVSFCYSFLHFVTHFLMSGLYVLSLSLFELNFNSILKDEIINNYLINSIN